MQLKEINQHLFVSQTQRFTSAVVLIMCTFKVWTQWDESQSWLEELLQGLEHRLHSMKSEEQTEEALQRSLSTYQVRLV